MPKPQHREPRQRETVVEDRLGEDKAIPFRYSITSYGADYPVDGLVHRMREGDIYVPDFQRSYVWKPRQASRFIESLLLGLPVPGIFLAKEDKSQKLLVIDGQQRLRTLQYFYSGVFPDTKKPFVLVGVQDQFLDRSYSSLPDHDKRRINDAIIHATIVRQDEPSDDESSIYHIFERLNTGGISLEPQEIRSCIYHGPLIDLLKRLNENQSWRTVFGPTSKTGKDQELILRYLAMADAGDTYQRPMKEFLNRFAASNRHPTPQAVKRFEDGFVGTIELICKALGRRAFRPATTLNAAVFDAVMVGLSKRLGRGNPPAPQMVRRRYESLLKNKEFTGAVVTGTADEERVKRRLRLATQVFA